MTKFTVLSLLSSIFLISVMQAVQVINNTSGVVTLSMLMSHASSFKKYRTIHPGETRLLSSYGFDSVVEIAYPECAINAQHVQFDIGEINETDAVSFVEVDNTIIAFKEHKGQVIKLKEIV